MKKETVRTIEKTIFKIEILIGVCNKHNEKIISDELSSIQNELQKMLSSSESSKDKDSSVNMVYVARLLTVLKIIHDIYTRFF